MMYNFLSMPLWYKLLNLPTYSNMQYEALTSHMYLVFEIVESFMYLGVELTNNNCEDK